MVRLSAPSRSTPPPVPQQIARARDEVRNEESYAQATGELVRMAFVSESYPDKKLGADEVAEIRKLIRSRILGMSGDAKAPTFTGLWEINGGFVLVCVNKESKEWLRRHSSDWIIEMTPLRVLSAGKLPKRHRVVVHVKKLEVEIEEALKFLNQQNTGRPTNGLSPGEVTAGML